MQKHNQNPDPLEELQRRKLEREIEKVEVEISQLKRKWYKTPSNVIQLLVPILGAFLAWGLYWATGAEKLLDIRKENLAQQEKQLIESTGKIRKDSLALVSTVDSLKLSVNFLARINEQSKIEKDRLSTENRKLEHHEDLLYKNVEQLEIERKGLKSELKERNLKIVLASIDSMGVDFNPKNKLYGQLKQSFNSLSKDENYKLINAYIGSENKLLNIKLTVLLATYNKYLDRDVLNKFIEFLGRDGSSIYCDDPDKFQSIVPILISNDLNAEDYHLILSTFILKIASIDCRGESFKWLSDIRNRRKDDNLAFNKDVNYYLNYLKLFRKYVLKSKLNQQTGDLKTISNEKLPAIVLSAYWSEFVIHDIDSAKAQNIFFSYPDRGSYSFGKINSRTMISSNFMRDWQEKNISLVHRLLEPNFETYRKNKSLLESDLK